MKYGVNRSDSAYHDGLVWIVAGANVLRIGVVTWMNNDKRLNHSKQAKQSIRLPALLRPCIPKALLQAHPAHRTEKEREKLPLLASMRKDEPYDIHDCSPGIHPPFSTAARYLHFRLLHGAVHALILTGILFLRYWWLTNQKRTFAAGF